ncbi:MAG: 5-formyltetrahydrofolate cyclo-ligase, partial [Rhodocyclaceae bacterium]|nr:5-formyltetrahydrofolate cyclo-ligase [Rhodocyclaceae bacterium]
MKKKPQDAGVRQTLRRALLEWREGLPREAQSAAAERVNAYLLDWLGARAPTTIGFCWPMRGEIDCRPTIEALIARAWQAVIPVVVALAAPMEFRSWRPGAPMGKDPYGIPIPLTPPAPPPAVLLLPLVAFDAQGYRLGYGGGYFDRTLAAL